MSEMNILLVSFAVLTEAAITRDAPRNVALDRWGLLIARHDYNLCMLGDDYKEVMIKLKY